MTRATSSSTAGSASPGVSSSRVAPARGADLLERFQAVAEETRFRVVRLLSGGERCVCELQAQIGVSQSLLSFHLKKLKDAGVVAGRRDGRWVHYSLVPESLEEMRSFLGEVKPAVPAAEAQGRHEGCCS